MSLLRPEPWYRREVTRFMWVLTFPLAATLWFVLGVWSMKRLGKVLERTGLNLQSYDW